MNAAEKARIAREEAEKEKKVKQESLEEKKEVEKIKNQIDELAKVKQWKPVVFGNYMDKNGKAPLEWLVLDKCGDEITLVTKNIIDCHEFCENVCTSWKDSDIREWLNGEFIDKAFNKNEQKFLVSKSIDSDYGEVDGGKFVTTKDKVYLLSSKDFSDKKQGKGLAKLFGKTAKDMLFNCKPTKYAESKGIVNDGNDKKHYCWWLRDMQTQMQEKEYQGTGFVSMFDDRDTACRGVVYAGSDLYVAFIESNVFNGKTRMPNTKLRLYKSFGVRPVITLKID